MQRFTTASPAETEALGERLGRALRGGEVLAYRGGLGMGKTCFTRGLARGLGMDARRVRQAAYLHDIARLLPDHAHAGALWLEALGYGSLAPLVRGHMTHPGDVLDEAGAVCLADKLVLHGRRCSVDERFAASREKCKTPEARAAHAERYAEAKRLETLAKERGVIL